MLSAFFTVAGDLFLIFGSLLFALLAILFGWIPPRGNLMFLSGRCWSRGLLFVSGVRLQVERDPAIDRRGRYIYMANHQSLFDIPVLLATLPGQARFMAKRSLFRIPIFGWALSVGGFIPVDRHDRSKAREVFATAVARLQAGASVLIFPEETRSVDGNLLPFQRGGFLLAMKSELPIVPVGIRGTLHVQSKNSWLIRPGVVTVRYGRPIEVAGFDLHHKGELVRRVRQRIAALAGVDELGAHVGSVGAASI